MDASSYTAHVLSDLTFPPQRWVKPVLIGTFGVPGAGKTEVARYLSHRHPLLILSTDALRLQYRFESGLVTRQVMDHLAIQLLPQRIGMVFDGIHLGRKDRRAVVQLAHACQADALLLYVVADPAVIEQRLQTRMEQPAIVAAERKFVITPEHFGRIVSYLEPPTDDEAVKTVDTSQDCIAAQLDLIEHHLEQCLRGG
jgi:predicted kinase